MGYPGKADGRNYYLFPAAGADPQELVNHGKLYTKEVGGITELFYQDDAGVITQLTPLTTVPYPFELPEEAADPAPIANTGLLYTKDVAGVSQLFYEASDGTVSQLTPAAYPFELPEEAGDPAPIVNTGQLYTKDVAGSTELFYENAAGGIEQITPVQVEPYPFQLPEEAADPAPVLNTGLLYTKDVAGVSELFYEADDGTVSQLSPQGAGYPYPLTEEAADPAPTINTGYLYSKDAAGITQLYYSDDTGAVTQLTPVSSGAPVTWTAGAGSPNSVVVGSPGDMYSNTNGGAGLTLWLKESGAATNTGWIPVCITPNGTTANRPVAPLAGTMYFDTTLSLPIWYIGGVWLDAAGVSV